MKILILFIVFAAAQVRAREIGQIPLQIPKTLCELELSISAKSPRDLLAKAAHDFYSAQAQFLADITPFVNEALIKEFGDDVELFFVSENRSGPGVLGGPWSAPLFQFVFYQSSKMTLPPYRTFDTEEEAAKHLAARATTVSVFQQSTYLTIDVTDENTPWM